MSLFILGLFSQLISVKLRVDLVYGTKSSWLFVSLVTFPKLAL